MGIVKSAYASFIENSTIDDDPVIYEYIYNHYYKWILITGSYWDWKTVRGQVMTATIISISGVFVIIHFLLSYMSLVKAFNWRIDVSLELLVVTVVFFLLFFLLITPIVHRREVSRVFKTVATGFTQYNTEVINNCERIENIHKKLKKYFFLLPMTIIASYLFFIFSRPDTTERIVNGLDLRLLMPSYCPFYIESWPLYVLMNLMQISGIYILVVTVSLFTYILIDFLMHWLYQMQRLLDSLNRIEQRALHMLRNVKEFTTKFNSKYDLYHNNDFVDCYLICLKENVNHHLTLKRWVNKLLLLWNVVFSIYYTRRGGPAF